MSAYRMEMQFKNYDAAAALVSAKLLTAELAAEYPHIPELETLTVLLNTAYEGTDLAVTNNGRCAFPLPRTE